MRLLITIVLSLTTGLAFSQGNRVPIIITLSEVPSDAKIYLYVGEGWEDSSDLKNGVAKFFVIKESSEPTAAVIVTSDKKRQFTLFVEDGPLLVSGSYDNFDLLQFQGSATQNDYAEYRRVTKVYDDSLSKAKYLLSKYRNLKTADTIQQLLEVERLKSPLRAIKKNFIISNPNSFISSKALAIDHRSRFFTDDEALMLFSKLSKENQNSKHGQSILESIRLYKKPKVGDPAPTFKMTNESGVVINTATFKGRPVLILFWASWCGPCRVEAPYHKEVYDKYRQKGFEVIAVSLDDKKDPWMKYIENNSYGWINLSDLKGWENIAALTYGVSRVPDNFLLDDKGVVIGIDLQPRVLDKVLGDYYSR